MVDLMSLDPSIGDQAVRGIELIQKIAERPALEPIQQFFI
jgi:hypothetical protein